jgi:sugar/nucleoside kinase (ribokinase family)
MGVTSNTAPWERQRDRPPTALRFAARVAAYSCQTFGTRAWTESWPGS